MTRFMYPALLNEMHHYDAKGRVLDALRVRPMSVTELSKHVQIRAGLIRFTIEQLRKAGHRLDNRGAHGGINGVRGKYWLVGGTV